MSDHNETRDNMALPRVSPWKVSAVVVGLLLAALGWFVAGANGERDDWRDRCVAAGGVPIAGSPRSAPSVCIDRDALIEVTR